MISPNISCRHQPLAPYPVSSSVGRARRTSGIILLILDQPVRRMNSF